MPTSRSYQDQCGIARALDVVGERWALLIVRELIHGPQRFSDLRRVLTNTSANVISDRLRELEAHGVIQRRKLSPPASAWVYELAPWGRELDPILIALGNWGLRAPLPPPPTVLSPASVLIYLRTCARPDPAAPPSVVRIGLDEQVWTAQTSQGRLTIEAGEPSTAHAAITTDPSTFNALIGHTRRLKSGVDEGTTRISGDTKVLRRLLQEVEMPSGS